MGDEVDCREASRLLSMAREREPAGTELQSLRRHLALCGMCRNFEAQLEFLHRAAERLRSGE